MSDETGSKQTTPFLSLQMHSLSIPFALFVSLTVLVCSAEGYFECSKLHTKIGKTRAAIERSLAGVVAEKRELENRIKHLDDAYSHIGWQCPNAMKELSRDRKELREKRFDLKIGRCEDLAAFAKSMRKLIEQMRFKQKNFEKLTEENKLRMGKLKQDLVQLFGRPPQEEALSACEDHLGALMGECEEILKFYGQIDV